MNKTTDFHIFKHWQNEQERSNEQDNWLPHLQSLAERTWRTQWARQLTPTSTTNGRMNKKNAKSKTTDSHIYKHWQNEHERSNEQDNLLPHLQSMAEWTWKTQLARQLTPTSISSDRMNMKDAMSKTTDSLIYKHWQTEHDRSNEQDNWLPCLQALADWTWKTQWARQLTL